LDRVVGSDAHAASNPEELMMELSQGIYIAAAGLLCHTANSPVSM
jgi:hypothetical protein